MRKSRERKTSIAPDNHTDLKHIEAKAATKTAEGNIEYWYCEGCGKYYSDAKAAHEITLEQTVIEKLPGKEAVNNLPKTGDDSRVALWLLLLAVSGGVLLKNLADRRKNADLVAYHTEKQTVILSLRGAFLFGTISAIG